MNRPFTTAVALAPVPPDAEDRAVEAVECPPAARRLALRPLVGSALVRSPYEGSTPAVVPPPTPPAPAPAPASQPAAPGPEPGPSRQTPEPSALPGAAVGSSLVLSAWLRRRRRRA